MYDLAFLARTYQYVIPLTPKKMKGAGENKCENKLQHTLKQYTDGQLSAYNCIKVIWRTTFTEGQCAILSLAGSQNLCQTHDDTVQAHSCLHCQHSCLSRINQT